MPQQIIQEYYKNGAIIQNYNKMQQNYTDNTQKYQRHTTRNIQKY